MGQSHFLIRIMYDGFDPDFDSRITSYMRNEGTFEESGFGFGKREIYYAVPAPWSFDKGRELEDIGSLHGRNLTVTVMDVQHG